jgi:hypothetical protein
MDMDNEFVFKTLFVENKRDKYRYETYKVDKNKLKEYGKYLNENVVSKLNVNVDYTVNDIYTLFEKKIPEYKDLFEYLTFRDVFNNYTEWIILLKKIFNLLNITDYTLLVKNTPMGVCLDINFNDKDKSPDESSESSESSESLEGLSVDKKVVNKTNEKYNNLWKVLYDIFSEIGVVIKDHSNKHINPSMFEIFGINKNKVSVMPKVNKVIKNKKDINFNEFFPGKSNGRIVRYLKIYKMIPNKTDYDKNDFRKDLIDTGFVEVKGNVMYYIKDNLDDLKEWITGKILE